MGQSGLTTGLALYEDLEALRQLWAGERADEDNAQQSVATSVTFGEAWDIPVADLEAAQRHGRQLARHSQGDPAREEMTVPVASGPLKLVLAWVEKPTPGR
jgi:hypothetical protein